MNSIISNPEKYQQKELLKLMHGVFDCLQTVTDIAVRVTARSVMARRRICLSQISFKDNNASRELMSLPMSGNLLFQGQLTDIMHKYATFSRDARETSDYASAAGSKGQKHRHGPGDGSTQVSKKLAVTKPAQGPNKGKKPFSFKKPALSTATNQMVQRLLAFAFAKSHPQVEALGTGNTTDYMYQIPQANIPVGGRLQKFAYQLENITTDIWVTQTLSQGYKIEFISQPPQFQGIRETSLPSKLSAKSVLLEEVQDLLRKRAIELVPESDKEKGFYSRFFLVPKKDGGLRSILNLRPLNKFVKSPRFKMQTLRSIIQAVQPGEWLAKID